MVDATALADRRPVGALRRAGAAGRDRAGAGVRAGAAAARRALRRPRRRRHPGRPVAAAPGRARHRGDHADGHPRRPRRRGPRRPPRRARRRAGGRVGTHRRGAAPAPVGVRGPHRRARPRARPLLRRGPDDGRRHAGRRHPPRAGRRRRARGRALRARVGVGVPRPAEGLPAHHAAGAARRRWSRTASWCGCGPRRPPPGRRGSTGSPPTSPRPPWPSSGWSRATRCSSR